MIASLSFSCPDDLPFRAGLHAENSSALPVLLPRCFVTARIAICFVTGRAGFRNCIERFVQLRANIEFSAWDEHPEKPLRFFPFAFGVFQPLNEVRSVMCGLGQTLAF